MTGSVVASMKRDASSSPSREEADDAAEARHLARRDRVIRVARKAGIEDALHAWMRLEPGRDAEGRLVLRCTRSSSVLAPRRRRYAACGSRTAPRTPRRSRRPAMRAAFPESEPARRSLWPPRYFVAEWRTRSTPNSRGRSLHGRRERGVDQDLHAGVPVQDGDEAREVHDPEVRVRGSIRPGRGASSRPDRARARRSLPGSRRTCARCPSAAASSRRTAASGGSSRRS